MLRLTQLHGEPVLVNPIHIVNIYEIQYPYILDDWKGKWVTSVVVSTGNSLFVRESISKIGASITCANV